MSLEIDPATLRWFCTGVVCLVSGGLAAAYLLLDLLARGPGPGWPGGPISPELPRPQPNEPVELSPLSAPDPADHWDHPANRVRRASRRRLGAGLVLVISVAFFYAANYAGPVHDFDTGQTQAITKAERDRFAAIWLMVMAQVMWLLVIAALDFRETLRHYRHQRAVLAARRQAWGQRGANKPNGGPPLL